MVAALYRRYRPDSFAEMIGQSQVTEPLMTALRTGRIGHAYLFSGPRGCGKTTSARILARCLNCAEGPTDTPCGKCPSCIELSRDGGGSLDVVEIDAASHGGVDDARDLRERAVFAPARDRFKIFIIDEAHMVTPGGFNALLKIVEEPPPHVKFIFATTEPDKVIGTIRSRTHHYPFRLIAPATLIDYVQSLCDSEGVQVEPGVLPLVVRAGGGSARDTLSILDQLIAGSEGNLVTATRAAGLLGFTHTELLDDVVVAFGAHDSAAAFQATDRVVQTGQDPRRFVEDLLERLRDLIVVTATTVEGAAAVFRGVPQDQLTRMFEQAQAFGPGELSRIADTVSATLDKMAGATAPRLQLELMIARALVVHGESARRAVGGGNAQTTGVQAAGAQTAQRAAVPLPQTPVVGGASHTSAPVPPTRSAPDPVAALAAARGAVTTPAAAPVPAASVPAATSAPAASAAAPSTPTAGPNGQSEGVPNAAQTAASIRDFLREDDAVSSGPQTETQQDASAPAGAAIADVAQSQHEQPGSSPHPNEAAASFGRPISDVLSTSQIESIGSEPAAASAAPPAPSAASVASAPGAAADSAQAAASTGAAAAAHPVPAPGDPLGTSEPPLEGGEDSGLEDLLEVWPDLLEEILERDREAWNAVRAVVPLSLEGDVLAVGLATQSDLAAFKSVGAGPLRETILSSVGISVKYVPKRLPEGHAAGAQNAPRETQTGSAADAEEPHRAGENISPASSVGQAAGNDPEQRAAARLSALGPALAAPAWADPPPEPVPSIAEVLETAAVSEAEAVESEQVAGSNVDVESEAGSVTSTQTSDNADTYIEPSDDLYSDGDPYGDGDPFPGESGNSAADSSSNGEAAPADSALSESDADAAAEAAATPAPKPESVMQAEAKVDPEPAPTVDQPTAAEPTAAQPGNPARSVPAFTRYGEAVVREVLGARFIEEHPLPPRQEA